MRPIKQKGLLVTTISLSLIIVFGVANSIAQEKLKMKDKRYWFTTKVEMMKVDGTEGHIVQITESKGVDVVSGGTAISNATWDLVKGNGTMQSYATNISPDGSKNYSKQQGKVVTVLSPQGKPVTTVEGTFTIINGTGQWEGAQGGGPWKLKVIGEGISVMDWEGEYTLKK